MRILIVSLTLFLISIILIPICLIDYGPSAQIQGLNLYSFIEKQGTSNEGKGSELKAVPTNVTIVPPWNYYPAQKSELVGIPTLASARALMKLMGLSRVGKGNETPGAVAAATFIDYPGEVITLRQIMTFSIIALFVVGVYIVSKYHNRIITRVKSAHP